MSRIRNLAILVKESYPRPRFRFLSEIVLGSGLVAAVYFLPASSIVTGISVFGGVALLSCALFWSIYVASATDNAEDRRLLIKRARPEIQGFVRGGLAILISCHAVADNVASYAAGYPQLSIVCFSILGILFTSWITAKIQTYGLFRSNHETHTLVVRETSDFATNRELSHSSTDIRRLAAFTAGRLICFAHTPYLSESTRVVLEGNRSTISYRANDQYESIQTLEWIVFEGLAGIEAETLLVGNTSNLIAERFDDINSAMEQIMNIKAASGSMPVPMDAASPSEVLVKAQRKNYEIRRRVEVVREYIKSNTDALTSIFNILSNDAPIDQSEILKILETQVTSHPQIPLPESCEPVNERPKLSAVSTS